MSSKDGATDREVYLWGIGGMADSCLYLMFACIFNVYTTGFKLRPELVSLALVFPRVIDAALDPIIGHYSDHLRSRWGRRRPIIFISTVVGALAVMGLWWPSPNWNEYVLFAYLCFFSVLLFVLYGSFSMSHTALGYELSDDYHVRTKVIAVRQMFMSITSSLLGGWVYWLALRPAFGNEITGMRWVSAGWAVILLAAGLIPAIWCRERYHQPKVVKPHMPLGKAIVTVFRNPSMRLLVIFRICQTMGGAVAGQMGFFMTTYYVCGGNKSTSTSLNGIAGWFGFTGGLLLLPFAQKLSRKLGKRQAIIGCTAAAAISAISAPFFQIPGHPYILLLHGLLFMPTGIIGGLFLGAIVPDLCDMDELEHGERREGLISSVLQFVNKVEISLCVIFSAWLLQRTGFDAHLDQQPAIVLDRMRWYAFTPLIFFSIVCLVISTRFPFTEAMMADVRKRLEERKERKRLAETPAPVLTIQAPVAAPVAITELQPTTQSRS